MKRDDDLGTGPAQVVLKWYFTHLRLRNSIVLILQKTRPWVYLWVYILKMYLTNQIIGAELTRQRKYIRPITLEQMLLRGVA